MTAAFIANGFSSAIRRPASVRIEISSSLDRFRSVWPSSDNGTNESRHFPFQNADVLRVWYETIGRARGVEPVFAAISLSDGRPALLLPLCIERTGAVTVLRFPDFGVSDYNAPVVFPAAAAEITDMQELWRQLVEVLPPFDLAMLEKMPETVDGIPNPLAAIATRPHPESGHGVTLHGPWEEFAKSRLPRWRDSQRCLRNLERIGSVQLFVAADPCERTRIMDALFEQKRRRFEETNAIDLFDHPGVLDFYRRTSDCRRGCQAVVSALTLDGRVLAANWGLLSGDRYFDLMTSNEGGEFRTYAPGRLLNEWLLQWCIEQGVRVSDFGIGDEAYKFRYCDVHTPLHDAHIAVTMRGTFYASAMQLHLAAKLALRDTRLGTAIRAVRSRIQKFAALRPAKPDTRISAWIVALGSATLAIDA